MLFALLLLAAAPKVDTRLVGTWKLNGVTFITLNENATGTMDGEGFRWSADGKTLVLVDSEGEADRVAYQVDGDTLNMTMGMMPLVLTRGGKAKTPVVKQQETKQQPAGNDQLSRLLLSSNWCYLRYASGNTYTEKVHFNSNGTWQNYKESDIYANNAYAGSTAEATSGRSGGGQWAVRNGQLFLSSPEEPQLQPVPLTITKNSNGYPIINADGREYSMCN